MPADSNCMIFQISYPMPFRFTMSVAWSARDKIESLTYNFNLQEFGKNKFQGNKNCFHHKLLINNWLKH